MRERVHATFAVGVLALSQVETAREGGRAPRTGYVLAGTAFLVCAAAVARSSTDRAARQAALFVEWRLSR